ncbi:hypothetical protein D3C78_771490 [compost metagenome]
MNTGWYALRSRRFLINLKDTNKRVPDNSEAAPSLLFKHLYFSDRCGVSSIVGSYFDPITVVIFCVREGACMCVVRIGNIPGNLVQYDPFAFT